MQRSRRALIALALAAAHPLISRSAGEQIGLKRWSGAPQPPPMDLLRPDGTPFTLAALRGKVVLVNFWATWCEPCVAEMPSLQRLRDELGSERFEVVGVNHKEGPARIETFVRDARIAFPIVRDTDGDVARRWGARVFPSTYVIDRDGVIRYAVVGEADWTSPPLVSTIRPLLGPPPRR